MRVEVSDLSIADLRSVLKANVDQLHCTSHIDLEEACSYLFSLTDDEHSEDSAFALLYLARNLRYAAQPAMSLQAALRATPLAVGLQNKLLIYATRSATAIALGELGRFPEAASAQAEVCLLARELGDVHLEIYSTGNFGKLCCGMAQWNAAIQYFEHARKLAEEHHLCDLEFHSRGNLADCSLQLHDPAAGLRALKPIIEETPQTKVQMEVLANSNHTLARLYLMIGDVAAARHHAEAAARLAEIANIVRSTNFNLALAGLIDVRVGAIDEGLLKVERALSTAMQGDQTDIPDFLGLCAEAYEHAGQPDVALKYLEDLVKWKKASIEAGVMPLQHHSHTEPIRLHPDEAVFKGSLERANVLHASIRDRVDRLIETAINAEMANGYDVYRIFRVAKLSHCLALSIGRDKRSADQLLTQALLCNVGMVALPARLLLKPAGLSSGETAMVSQHARYGGELLRKSKLQLLRGAAVIAEQHHERYDGRGYPRGLSGNAIDEDARIVTICDAFDAMTHRRPWRASPLTPLAAFDELGLGGAMGQFDPDLVKAFVNVIASKLHEIENLETFLTDGADQLEYVRV